MGRFFRRGGGLLKRGGGLFKNPVEVLKEYPDKLSRVTRLGSVKNR